MKSTLSIMFVNCPTVVRAVINGGPKVRVIFSFALSLLQILHSVIGAGNSGHFLNQTEEKPKPICDSLTHVSPNIGSATCTCFVF